MQIRTELPLCSRPRGQSLPTPSTVEIQCVIKLIIVQPESHITLHKGSVCWSEGLGGLPENSLKLSLGEEFPGAEGGTALEQMREQGQRTSEKPLPPIHRILTFLCPSLGTPSGYEGGVQTSLHISSLGRPC